MFATAAPTDPRYTDQGQAIVLQTKLQLIRDEKTARELAPQHSASIPQGRGELERTKWSIQFGRRLRRALDFTVLIVFFWVHHTFINKASLPPDSIFNDWEQMGNYWTSMS
ncbi:hypothetical protein RRG08_035261 [Elysia crispata]|uniref:Uncharacterized protein n=1 Tax=Elysia crispata TaxID=231223 RepID=A0AAE0ZE71_9GAST|nr:hypothetical protein RRG08_035261 [Elysia crispata]